MIFFSSIYQVCERHTCDTSRPLSHSLSPTCSSLRLTKVFASAEGEGKEEAWRRGRTQGKDETSGPHNSVPHPSTSAAIHRGGYRSSCNCTCHRTLRCHCSCFNSIYIFSTATSPSSTANKATSADLHLAHAQPLINPLIHS